MRYIHRGEVCKLKVDSMTKFIKLHLVRTLNKYRELQRMRVRDIMVSGDVVVARPENTVKDVFESMVEYNINGIPVIDERGKIVGLVTIKEIKPYLANGSDVKIEIVMLKDPPYTTVDEDIITAFEKMINFDRRLDQLPVINTNSEEMPYGKLVGVVYIEDIITLLYEKVIKELKTLVSLYNGNKAGSVF